jgi:hypothetical protein
MIDLWLPSYTPTHNHNQLQKLTINLQFNISSLTAVTRFILVLILRMTQISLYSPTLLYPFCIDLTENASYIVNKDSLRRRCLAIYLLLFRAFVSAGIYLENRCLAMGTEQTT